MIPKFTYDELSRFARNAEKNGLMRDQGYRTQQILKTVYVEHFAVGQRVKAIVPHPDGHFSFTGTIVAIENGVARIKCDQPIDGVRDALMITGLCRSID